MHLVLLTRGHQKCVDRFIKELSSNYVNFPYYNKETKRMEEKLFEMRVCPVQLWDITYPKGQRDAVLTTVLAKGDGKPMNKYINKFIWGLRKCMGLKPLKDYKKDFMLRMSPPEHIELIAVGEKEDFWITEDGKHVKEEDKTSLSMEGL